MPWLRDSPSDAALHRRSVLSARHRCAVSRLSCGSPLPHRVSCARPVPAWPVSKPDWQVGVRRVSRAALLRGGGGAAAALPSWSLLPGQHQLCRPVPLPQRHVPQLFFRRFALRVCCLHCRQFLRRLWPSTTIWPLRSRVLLLWRRLFRSPKRWELVWRVRLRAVARHRAEVPLVADEHAARSCRRCGICTDARESRHQQLPSGQCQRGWCSGGDWRRLPARPLLPRRVVAPAALPARHVQRRGCQSERVAVRAVPPNAAVPRRRHDTARPKLLCWLLLPRRDCVSSAAVSSGHVLRWC